MPGIVKRFLAYAEAFGLPYTLQRICEKGTEKLLHRYHRRWLTEKTTDEELYRQRQHQPDAGLISIVIPVYNTRPALLRELCGSLTAQTYENWEACLYDGASTLPETREALADAAGADSRIHVQYGAANEGISGNSNLAVSMANGQWIVLCDHDDILMPDALWRVAETIVHDQPDFIYSDEDKITEDGRWHTDPHDKPDYCHENLLSGNYICHLAAMRTELFRRIGGFRPAFDGSQDHDLFLRCTEHTERISHIERILYSWRTVGSSASHSHLDRCLDASARAAGEHLMRIGTPGTVSVKNGMLDIEWTLQPSTVDVVLLNGANGHEAVCREALKRQSLTPDSIMSLDPSADYAGMLRQAAAASDADLILVMADDVIPEDNDFLRHLAAAAQQLACGFAVPKLVAGRRILSAGLGFTDEGILNRGQGLDKKNPGWHHMMCTLHNVSAASSFCFCIRRTLLEQLVDGDSSLEVMLMTGIALQQSGFRHMYVPKAAAGAGKRTAMEARTSVKHTEQLISKLKEQYGQDFHDACYRGHFGIC